MVLDECYYIEEINESHGDEISRFLEEHFLKEEPLNRASKMTVKNFKPFVEKLLERTLNIPFSTVIRSKDNNQIIACAMSSLWSREIESLESHESDEFVFDDGENRAVIAVGNILTRLHSSFFNLLPEVNNVLHLEILSVSKEHQRKGLASQLMTLQENPENFTKFGLTGIASEISSYANQCLMEKRGYSKLNEILLESEKNPDGSPTIQCDDGTDRVVLVYKEIALN